MPFKTKTKSVRRVVTTLPEDKALALADAITDNITWHDTNVEKELAGLHDALQGNA